MTSELHKKQRTMKDLVKWTAVLSLNLNSLLDKKLETFGINSSQFVYILKICRNPGMTRECIFHEIYRNPSNISRALTQLEEKGYLTKEPSREDRRTCHLYPTKKAQEVYGQIEEILSGCDQEIMEVFSEEEKEIFPGILKKAALRAVEMNEKGREKGGNKVE